jgi:hypothetical protein
LISLPSCGASGGVVGASWGEWAWFAVEVVALGLVLVSSVRGAAKKKNERCSLRRVRRR